MRKWRRINARLLKRCRGWAQATRSAFGSVNNPAEAGIRRGNGWDVFTEVVRNEEMRNQSFIINVTADFLEKQPEILFEASSLHEVCHVMNDDLTGYHRNGANIEVAEEHCVLQAVGEARYQEYLKAYAAYRHWDTSTYETVSPESEGRSACSTSQRNRRGGQNGCGIFQNTSPTE